MKQFDNATLCKYCLGCNKCENPNFGGVYRCKWFYPGYTDWQEKLYKSYKNKKHEN